MTLCARFTRLLVVASLAVVPGFASAQHDETQVARPDREWFPTRQTAVAEVALRTSILPGQGASFGLDVDGRARDVLVGVRSSVLVCKACEFPIVDETNDTDVLSLIHGFVARDWDVFSLGLGPVFASGPSFDSGANVVGLGGALYLRAGYGGGLHLELSVGALGSWETTLSTPDSLNQSSFAFVGIASISVPIFRMDSTTFSVSSSLHVSGPYPFFYVIEAGVRVQLDRVSIGAGWLGLPNQARWNNLVLSVAWAFFPTERSGSSSS